MDVWRISEFADLSGRGGELYSGRWNHAGDAIVYCAEHPALALVEVLVNLGLDQMPETLQLTRIDIPDDVPWTDIEEHSSVAGMAPDHPERLASSRALWAGFVETNRFPVLKVPSVIVPYSFNYLINPRHADASRIIIASQERFALDPRFVS